MAVRLKSLRYWQLAGQPNEWVLDGLSLGSVNLIVGTNATGKTRTLNVIWNLARLFVPEPKFRTENAGYELLFDNDGQPIRYSLDIVEGKVKNEELIVSGERVLSRGPGGEGEIVFVSESRKKFRFRPPENELAAAARRDSLQHPFLEPLHEWAQAVRHYTFGASLGKDHVAVLGKNDPEPNERDPNQVIGIFRKAEKELGPAFKAALIRDMAELNYAIDDVGVCMSMAIKVISEGVSGNVAMLGVKERGVGGIVQQQEMSQGMFRVLSILIQVNYTQMGNRANCILIDDIGEGLDFTRSSRLIEMLMRKAKDARFQLVMTTNDQFVMNHVPLECWSVLRRQGTHIQVRNHENSREMFEEFKFIGLSNFSFLEMDFANGPMGKVAGHE